MLSGHETNLCRTCKGELARVFLEPCGHTLACMNCIGDKSCSICPLCDGHITMVRHAKLGPLRIEDIIALKMDLDDNTARKVLQVLVLGVGSFQRGCIVQELQMEFQASEEVQNENGMTSTFSANCKMHGDSFRLQYFSFCPSEMEMGEVVSSCRPKLLIMTISKEAWHLSSDLKTWPGLKCVSENSKIFFVLVPSDPFIKSGEEERIILNYLLRSTERSLRSSKTIMVHTINLGHDFDGSEFFQFLKSIVQTELSLQWSKDAQYYAGQQI